MENALTKIRKQTIKLLKYGKSKIMEDFWPEDENFDIKEFKKSFGVKNDPNENFYAESISVYSLLLATSILEFDLSKLQNQKTIDEMAQVSNGLCPTPIFTREDLFEKLQKKPPYNTMSEEEFTRAVYKIVLNDVRNSFAHGNFACIKKTGKDGKEIKQFWLIPNRSPFTCDDYMIVVKYDDVFNALALKMQLLMSNTEEYSNIKQNDFNLFAKKYLVPNLLFGLATYYHTGWRNEKFEHSCKQPDTTLLMQYLLSETILLVNQNVCHEKFGPDSDLFKNISFNRNSTAHNTSTFSNHGKNIVLHNPQAKPGEDTQREFSLYDLALAVDTYNAQIDENEHLAQGLEKIKSEKTK